MQLSDVVASHGFQPCPLARVDNGRLYQRQNLDGVLELLCIQKIGDSMRVDRQPLIPLNPGDIFNAPLFLPIGEAISDCRLPRDQLEDYLNTTL